MSSPGRILIYAELLSNIRQISVGCSLPSACSPETTASVSDDGLTMTIRHQCAESSVRLPGRVNAPLTLPMPDRGTPDLAWRLPLAAPGLPAGPVSGDGQAAPWSAQDIRPNSVLRCRACRAVIVPEGAIAVWKDLPSENWAEMMEFWHCHKPHDHGQGDHDHLDSKGYGANSRLAGQTGVGLVDLASFLFSRSDCRGLASTPTSSSPEADQDSRAEENGAVLRRGDSDVIPSVPRKYGASVYCRECRTELGVAHDETSSATLYKWQLCIDGPADPLTPRPPQPSLANCVSSMLMATLSRSGCSKSVIVPAGAHPSSASSQLLHIWLFNNNIIFSTTETATDDGAVAAAVPAVKVLHRMVTKAEADRMVESMTSDVQEITLPDIATAQLRQLLEKSNKFLPEADRRFKEWTVGLLEKWTGNGG